MSEHNTTTDELKEIRDLMERSSICVSLSGLGGILVGVCALTGVAAGVLWAPQWDEPGVFFGWAGSVFLSALLCIVFLSYRRSRQMKTTLWNTPTRHLVIHWVVPFVAGSFIVLKLWLLGLLDLVPVTSLVVYGVAVFSASHYGTSEIRWLAYAEILLGCVGLCFPAFGWQLWAIGFGFLHILVGAMKWRSEKKEVTHGD